MISSTVSRSSFISSATKRAYSIVMWEFPPKNGSFTSSRLTRTSTVSIRHFLSRSSSATGISIAGRTAATARRSSTISLWSRMKSDVPNRRTSSELRIVVKEERTTTRVFGETRARRRLNSTPE